MYKVLPLITSEYSLKSLVQLKNDDEPGVINLFECAKKYEINPVYLVDENLNSLYRFVKLAAKNNLNARFGWKAKYQSEEGNLNSVSKIILFISGNNGYQNVCELSKLACEQGSKDGTNVPKLTGEIIKNFDLQGVSLCIPFYDSFIFNNLLQPDSACNFDLDYLKPTFFIENNNLPFDKMVGESVLDFTNTYGFEAQCSQTIYYETREDFLAYQVFRCKMIRSQLEKPEMVDLISNEFCFEVWREKENG